jgi:hypothetical protein
MINRFHTAGSCLFGLRVLKSHFEILIGSAKACASHRLVDRLRAWPSKKTFQGTCRRVHTGRILAGRILTGRILTGRIIRLGALRLPTSWSVQSRALICRSEWSLRKNISTQGPFRGTKANTLTSRRLRPSRKSHRSFSFTLVADVDRPRSTSRNSTVLTANTRVASIANV